MPEFSKNSFETLDSCHTDLQLICTDAIKIYDFTVLCGHRGRHEQELLFDNNKTKLHYPKSKHNQKPSLAVDIAPYPIDWSNHKRFYLLAGVMFSVAYKHNIKIRWGGDWQGNWRHEALFADLPHFELL